MGKSVGNWFHVAKAVGICGAVGERKVHYCLQAKVLLYLDFFLKAIKYLLDTMLDILY